MVGRCHGWAWWWRIWGESVCSLSHISFVNFRSDLYVSGTDSKALAVLSEQLIDGTPAWLELITIPVPSTD